MKKFSAVLFFCMLTFFPHQAAEAQELEMEGFSAGIGMMYSNEPSQLGFKLDAVYQFYENYRGVVDIGIFFPNKTDFGGGVSVKVTWWEVNLNGNYIFFESIERNMTAYALGGLSFLTRITDAENPNNNKGESVTYPGLNLGAGLEYKLQFADLFAEIKYTLSVADQFNVGVGLRFPIL